MMSLHMGAASGLAAGKAMAEYLLEQQISEETMRAAAYYGQTAGVEEAIAQGYGAAPQLLADVDPALADALGLKSDQLIDVDALAHLLSGHRADGGDLPISDQQHRGTTKYKNNESEDGKVRHRVAYIDLTFSTCKHASLGWAFAKTEAERNTLLQAHNTAVDETLRYIEQQAIRGRLGAGGEDGTEPGRMAAIKVGHFTARPTQETIKTDPETGEVYTELKSAKVAGDPAVHTHCLIPNLIHTASGRFVAIDATAFHGHVHHFGAVYQGILARELTALGVGVDLDPRTNMARIPSIDERAVDEFSKRSREGEKAARAYAEREGRDWDSLSPEQQAAFRKAGTHATRLDKETNTPAFEAWHAQAQRIGWEHETVLGTAGPVRPRAERLGIADQEGMRHLAEMLKNRAVIGAGDVRLAAARGFIAAGGSDSTDDIGILTRHWAKAGVLQDGQDTKLIWKETERGGVKITTELHRDQELELIDLARKGAADRRVVLTSDEISEAVARSGVSYAIRGGNAQREAVETVGTDGGVSVVIGAAGTGKSTAILSPLVNAWKHRDLEVWGTAQAWRQAKDLRKAGIDNVNVRALDPFLDGVKEGRIKLSQNSVVVLDEVGRIGTRQLLDVLRLRDEHGFKLTMLGDDKQVQAQPLTAKVLTPTGFQEMGQLAVGDPVLTPAGRVARITAVADHGVKDVYRVTFSDGRWTECCGEHLWKVWKEQNLYSDGSHATRTVINRGDRWRVVPLSEIKRWFDNGFIYARHAAVPLIAPMMIEHPPQEQPIPPYALGLLLGDGNFSYGIVRYCTMDPYLIDRLMMELPEYKATAYQKADNIACDYQLSLRDPSAHVKGRTRSVGRKTMADCVRLPGGRSGIALEYNGRSQTVYAWSKERGINYDTLWTRLAKLRWTIPQALGFEPRPGILGSNPYSPLSIAIESLGLRGARSHDKFIPPIYKTGSSAQRLAIIQGLLDTDGCLGSGETYAVFSTVSERLALDVQDISRSLGALATIAQRPPPMTGRVFRGRTIKGLRVAYLVLISHPDISQFFSLPRKREKAKPYSKNLRLRITSIVPVGQKEVRCIAIDDHDHLYVTDNYVVTHNSIEAGPVVDLLRRGLGPERVPEILDTIRQENEREQEIAGMWRTGDAAKAIAAKRSDGTAELVPGGYRDAVERVADLYAERRAATADRQNYSITISAPTNRDAHEIARLVRERRRVMGEVGPDQARIETTDGQGYANSLDLATGDRVRLFAQTRGVFTDDKGRRKSAVVGDNGTVLEVVAVDRGNGLSVRGESGKVAFVSWEALRDKGGSGRVKLAYGDVLTVDTAQGITSNEHIGAMPAGSSAIMAGKAYVAGSRHITRHHLVASQGAELREVQARRMSGLPQMTPAESTRESWENLSRNLSRVAEKDSALALLEGQADTKRDTAKALQGALRTHETREAEGLSATTVKETAAVRTVVEAIPAMAEGVAAVATQQTELVDRIAAVTESASPVEQIPPVESTPQPDVAEPVIAPARPYLRDIKITEHDAQDQFGDALRAHRLRLKGPPIMDGKLHYVPVDGNRGAEKSGAYKGFYGDGRWPAGAVYNFKQGGFVGTWKANGETVTITLEEARARAAKAAERDAQHRQERIDREAAGAAKAVAMIAAATPADPSHPYLVKKGVDPIGIYQDAQGRLLIPLRNAEGEVRNVQTIDAAGGKLFLPGAQKMGTFHMLGDLEPGKPAGIAEGYASAATSHRATEIPVAMALDTSNLAAVAIAIRQTDPDKKIIMFADNDHHLPLRDPPRPNVGKEKAEAAAAIVGAEVVMPPAAPEQVAIGKGTDWNDYEHHNNKAAVAAAIDRQINKQEEEDTLHPVETQRVAGESMSY